MRLIKQTEINVVHSIGQRILDLEMEISRLQNEQKSIKHIKSIIVHHQNIKQIVKYNVIVMMEAQSNYSTIYLQSGNKILTSYTLKYWQSQISCNDFVRTHKSFLVNRHHIQSIDKGHHQFILTCGYKAKYSREFKSHEILSNRVVTRILDNYSMY